MSEIDYALDAKTVRWPMLMSEIETWSRKRRENLLLKATKYHSSEDRCNSVYMGGMAHAGLRRALGYPALMPPMKPYEELLKIVDDETLNKGIRYSMHTIEYMLAHPVSKCPCCGQITPSSSLRKINQNRMELRWTR